MGVVQGIFYRSWVDWSSLARWVQIMGGNYGIVGWGEVRGFRQGYSCAEWKMFAGDVVWAGGYCSWVVRMGSHVMPGTILHIIQIYKDTALASNTQLWENHC